MPGRASTRRRRPVKTLRGIPNHYTYRAKLEAKWLRKGFSVRFC